MMSDETTAASTESAEPAAATNGEGQTPEVETYPHPDGALASNADEDFEGGGEQTTTQAEEPGTVPSTVSEESEPTETVAAQQPPEWMIAQQQYQAQMQQMLNAVMQQNQQQQQLWNTMMQQAQARQAQASFEASRPRPPPPDAPIDEWMKFQRSEIEWQRNQDKTEMQRLLGGYQGAVQNAVKELKEREAAARQQAIEARYAQEFAQLKATPGMQWLSHSEPQVSSIRHNVVRVIHNALLQNGVNQPLAQTAMQLKQALGIGAQTPQEKSATARTVATQALQSQRNNVQQRKGPIPGAATGKSGGGMKPDKAALARKYAKLGVQYPSEMKALYRLPV